MIWVVYGGLLLLYWHSPGFSKHLALLMEGRMEARVGDPWIITSGDRSNPKPSVVTAAFNRTDRVDLRFSTGGRISTELPCGHATPNSHNHHPWSKYIQQMHACESGPKPVLRFIPRNIQKPIEAIGSVIWEPHWLIFIQDFQVRVFEGPSRNDPPNQCLSEKWRSVSRTPGARKRTLSQCLEKNGISQNWGTHGPTKSRGLGMLGVCVLCIIYIYYIYTLYTSCV